jgi:hypothetical protein
MLLLNEIVKCYLCIDLALTLFYGGAKVIKIVRTTN